MNRRNAIRIAPLRLALLAAAAAALLSVQGCYYLQAARGQFEIWQKSEPLDEVIADPGTDAVLAARLSMLAAARDFASEDLGLPDNGSYRAYADLGRPYVVWNVFAAPEFSLTPETWCYLVVGCLAYRGYFREQAARAFAARLHSDGLDVHLSGIAAYSTLGKFSDPLLNTMLARDDPDLVALLFHELAHQRLFVKDDTAFNEAFASAVAEFGLRQWLTARGEGGSMQGWLARQAAVRARMALIERARADLAAIYAKALPDEEKRRQKALAFSRLAAELNGASDGATWSAAALNNAWMASVSLYRGNLPAFRRVFADCEQRWSCFYAQAEALAALPAAERSNALAVLAGD